MSLVCSKCKRDLPESSFSKKSSSKSRGYSYSCKQCHNEYNRTKWYVKNAESQKKANRTWKAKNKTKVYAYKYGLTEEQLLELLAHGKCEVCGSTEDLCIDHCHDTGIVRGLLCSSCNKGLGFFKDDPVLLTEAIKYLHKCPD